MYKHSLPFLVCLLACSGCRPNDAADSSQYPARPIKLVVPFGAGGGTDTYARIFKKAIDENDLLSQPLVIINRDGAGATIGSRFVKNAAPDGYTLLLLHDAILTAQSSGVVNYGPDAFEPIAATGEVGMVISVTEDSPYHTLAELMQGAADQPGEVKFAANMGALTHFAGLQLEHEHPGAEFRYIQSGGGANRFADLTGAHVDVTGFSLEEFVRFRAGGLRGLAYFGEQRTPAADDVPTALEQGYDVVATNTFYWWAPKGTPMECRQIFGEVLQKAIQTESVQAAMSQIYCDPFFITGPELQERIAASAERFNRVPQRSLIELPNYPLLVVTAIAVVGLLWVGQTQWNRRHGFGPRSFPLAGTADSAVKNENAHPLPEAGGRRIARSDLLSPDAVRLYLSALLTLAYVFLLPTVGFRVSTIVFVGLIGAVLAPRSLKQMSVLVIVALVLAFGTHLLLTQVAEIDLP